MLIRVTRKFKGREGTALLDPHNIAFIEKPLVEDAWGNAYISMHQGRTFAVSEQYEDLCEKWERALGGTSERDPQC